MSSDQKVRADSDCLRVAYGRAVIGATQTEVSVIRGVAIREFPKGRNVAFADYLLYVGGKALGVIEAKERGARSKGVELRCARYAQGMPAIMPVWRRRLPLVC